MEKAFLARTFNEAKEGKSGCLFCRPFQGMILHETSHFRILLDTFPVAEGHLMISSKDHYGSGGEIPLELFFELSALKEELQEKMTQIDRSFIFYEHGRAGCCLATSPDEKCEHFHLHCLPADVSIQGALKERFDEIQMDSYSDISSLFMEQGNYLYFEDTDRNKLFYPAEDDRVDSHLLRSLICEALYTPELADWEDFSDRELFIKSYEVVKDFYSREQLEAACGLLG